MQTDYLQYIFQAINTLLTQNLGFFDAMGQNLFRSFATILVAWYGIKSALSAASGKYVFQFDHFASLLLTISFGFAMVNYYNTPIPGIGSSFHNLVTNEAQFLSSRIDQANCRPSIAGVADFESRMDSPGWRDFLGTAIYVVVTILLAAAQAIALVVIAYGFIATAVCVLVGPDLRSVFHRSEAGMALLGLVPLLHPIRLLSSHRGSRRLCHWKSYDRSPRLPPDRHDFDRPAHCLVPCSLHHVSCFDLHAAENSGAHEPHLQRHGRRLLRGLLERVFG